MLRWIVVSFVAQLFFFVGFTLHAADHACCDWRFCFAKWRQYVHVTGAVSFHWRADVCAFE